MKPLTLPDDVYSPDQVSTAVLDLNDYQNALRDTAARARSKPKNEAAPAEPGALLKSVLEASAVDHSDPNNLDELRKQLEVILSKSPIAHITLATLPNILVKKKLAAWFRKEVTPNMLLTFAVRSDIGGGAVVQAGSHIYDFSFRNLLVANKTKIAEIASRV